MSAEANKRLVGWMAVLSLISIAAARDDLRLVQAVRSRDTELVRALLKQQADVNSRQPDGATALHWAVHWDDLETADLLIHAGAQANATNDLGVMPLSLACTNGSAPMVKRLLKAGANPNAALMTGDTAVMTAARTGSVDVVRMLLIHGADVNAKETSQGQTALMWAVAERHWDVARVLIQHGADVHARSKRGFTPVLFAARTGDLYGVRMLLAAGANVNDTALVPRAGIEPARPAWGPRISSSDGSTILLVATVRGHAALAEYLLEQGADPNAEGAGFTALHWAAGTWETQLTGVFGLESPMSGLRTGKPDLIKALLAHGANANAQIVKDPPRFGFTMFRTKLAGATPFFLAALAADPNLMRILVAHGADPLLATEENITPLMVAAGIGRIQGESRVTESSALDAVKLALELGGDVNAVSDAGNTALHGVAYLGWNTLLQFLVNKGANVNVTNNRGETPLIIADGKGERLSAAIVIHKSTADLLRRLGADDKLGSPNQTNAVRPD